MDFKPWAHVSPEQIAEDIRVGVDELITTEHTCGGFKFAIHSTALRVVPTGGNLILGTTPTMVIIYHINPEATLKRQKLIQRLHVAKAQRNKVLIRDLERQLTTL